MPFITWMGQTMTSWINPKLRKWLRIIHRDLGYAMVGLCIVYGVSGILLNHMNGKDPAFSIRSKTFHLRQNLSSEELAIHWKEKRELPELNKVVDRKNGRYGLMFKGGTGLYNASTGETTYEHYTRRQFVYWINRLHYNRVKGWTPISDIFAGALIFFALSGMLMTPGSKGLQGRGKWYLLCGIAIPVVYILLS